VIDPATGRAFGLRRARLCRDRSAPYSKAACKLGCDCVVLRVGQIRSEGLRAWEDRRDAVRGPVDVIVASPSCWSPRRVWSPTTLTTLPRVSSGWGPTIFAPIPYRPTPIGWRLKRDSRTCRRAQAERSSPSAVREPGVVRKRARDKRWARSSHGQVEADYPPASRRHKKDWRNGNGSRLMRRPCAVPARRDAFPLRIQTRSGEVTPSSMLRSDRGGIMQSRNFAVIYPYGAHTIYSRAHGEYNAFVATFR